jgi:hypothetical protein
MTVSMDDLDGEFYLAYGRAMGNWARLERQLGEIFLRITRMPHAMGLATYYSAKSFAGRVDMVQAVIPFAKTLPDGHKFLDRCTAIATTYSSTRNRFAHDPHIVQVDVSDLSAGKPSRRIGSMKGAAPVTLAHLENAGPNFQALADLIHASLGQRQKLLKEPGLSLGALALMPRDAADAHKDLGKANTLVRQIARQPD